MRRAMTDTTEIIIDPNGDETHESWIRVSASRVQGTPTVLTRLLRFFPGRCVRRPGYLWPMRGPEKEDRP